MASGKWPSPSSPIILTDSKAASNGDDSSPTADGPAPSSSVVIHPEHHCPSLPNLVRLRYQPFPDPQRRLAPYPTCLLPCHRVTRHPNQAPIRTLSGYYTTEPIASSLATVANDQEQRRAKRTERAFPPSFPLRPYRSWPLDAEGQIQPFARPTRPLSLEWARTSPNTFLHESLLRIKLPL